MGYKCSVTVYLFVDESCLLTCK